MKKKTRAVIAAILAVLLFLSLLAPLARASEAEPSYRAVLNDYGIHAEAAWDAGLTGAGVTVAVIDSGLNEGHLYGPKHVTPGRYFYWSESEDGQYELLDGRRYNYISSSDTSDVYGHGTAVAGIIADIAPDVNIIPIRWCVGPSDFCGWRSPVISSIYYAVEQGADVINLSMGGGALSAALREAVQQAVDAGCIVIAAVGNDGDMTISYPAAYDDVIGVGSIDKDGRLAGWSQRNGSTNVCAPGQDIISIGWTSYAALSMGSGTSFSAAVVSGAVALVKEAYPDMTPRELMELLEQSCDPVVSSDGSLEPEAGAGVLNVETLMQRVAAEQECVQAINEIGGCETWLHGEKSPKIPKPLKWFVTVYLRKILQSSLM